MTNSRLKIVQRVFAACGAVVLFAVLVPLVSASASPPGVADIAVTLHPDTWTPSSGQTVNWTLDVHNLSTDTAVESPSMWLGTNEGTGTQNPQIDAAGWNLNVHETGFQFWADFGVTIPPSSHVGITFQTQATGPSGTKVDVWSSVWADNDWQASPTQNNWANVQQVIDGKVIAGRVTADDVPYSDTGLHSVCVGAGATEQPWDWYGARTDLAGDYVIAVDPSRDYRVDFDPTCRQWMDGQLTEFARETWENQPTGETATNLDGAVDHYGIDAALGFGSSISGRVVSAADNSPLGDIDVSARVGNGWDRAWARTSPDGTYTMSGLAPGDYTVVFRDNAGRTYATEYYADSYDQAQAQTIPLQTPGSHVQGIDAALEPGGSVSGRITASDGGDISQVDLVLLSAGSDDGWNHVDWTEPAADGTYSFGGIPGGEYHVFAQDQSGTYAAEFFSGAYTLKSATAIPVQIGDVLTGIDFALEPGATIEGRVTEAASGAPIGGITIAAWSEGFNFEPGPSRSAVTDPDGTYRLTGLPATDTVVGFFDAPDDDWVDASWAAKFWDTDGNPSNADPVHLQPAQTVTGIDAALVPAARVSGRIYDHDGDRGLAGVAVALFFPIGGEPFGVTTTDADGRWSVSNPLTDMGIYVGTADVENVYGGQYPPMWYGNVPITDFNTLDADADGATPLVTGSGQRSGVDIVYNAPPPTTPPTTTPSGPTTTTPSGPTTTAPGNPGNPSGPTTTTPSSPGNPGNPGNPANPGNPGNPSNPPAPSGPRPAPNAPSAPVPSPDALTPRGPILPSAASPAEGPNTQVGSLTTSAGEPDIRIRHGVVATFVIGRDLPAPVDGEIVPGSVTIERPPLHGTAEVDTTLGAITYTPDPGYSGIDTFDYGACNTDGECGVATARIEVDPAEDHLELAAGISPARNQSLIPLLIGIALIILAVSALRVARRQKDDPTG